MTDREEARTFCFLLTFQHSLPIPQGTSFITSSSFKWHLQIKWSLPNSSTSFSLAPLNYSDSTEAINWDMAGIKSSSSTGYHEGSLRRASFNRGQFCCYHIDACSSADNSLLAHQVQLLMAKPYLWPQFNFYSALVVPWYLGILIPAWLATWGKWLSHFNFYETSVHSDDRPARGENGSGILLKPFRKHRPQGLCDMEFRENGRHS